MLPNCGGVAAGDPNDGGALAAGVLVELKANVAGLALVLVLKLKADEVLPNEGGADKAEFAFRLSAAFDPKIPDG